VDDQARAVPVTVVWEQYSDPDERRGDASREQTSHAVAWAAVKKKYEKKDGEWRKK
jgi:cation transport regulator